jgi:DNA-binding transcriptional regulator YdaS (Cro superfamily)
MLKVKVIMKTSTALRHFGSRTALAGALGISVAAVSQWGETVPPRRQYELEHITNGKLKASRKRLKPAA